MLSQKLTSALRTYIDGKECIEKDSQWKWKPKEWKNSYTYICKIDLCPVARIRVEGHYKMKWVSPTTGQPFVNINKLKLEAPKYTKHILNYLKGERDNNIKTVGDFNISLSRMYRLLKDKLRSVELKVYIK